MTDTIKLREALINHGIYPSRPRLAILDYLNKTHSHPTADVIFHKLRSSVPTLSLTTVYNTLKLFSEKGLCLLLTINEKQVCYDGHTHPHGHLLCTRCGTIHDITPEQDTLNTSGRMVDGHRIMETHYYYKGVCSDCLAIEKHS